jgi:hypothetical protein
MPRGNSAQIIYLRGTNRGNTSPAFTRDGKWLAYTEVYGPFQSRLLVRPVGAELEISRAPSRVPGPENTTISSPVWAPDSKRLFYLQGTRIATIFEWDRRGTPKQIYSGRGGLWGMSVAGIARGSGANCSQIPTEPQAAGTLARRVACQRRIGLSRNWAAGFGSAGPRRCPAERTPSWHRSNSSTKECGWK